ncbi:MAG: rhomboid family intramembrane serine protease [Anaerolineae bacterium]|nr:rhomboid family intramembrane serine protease [Anaerolineae bacterium]
MIPLQDTIRSRRPPIINWLIILTNVILFFYEIHLPRSALQRFATSYGVVPRRFLMNPSLTQIGTLFSSMFLHGGWAHLISNMWALYIFGDNIEERMGHWRYLFFYLISGVAAALTHILFQARSTVPVIGASGAISGVMGAYLVLYPGARVITLLPGLFFIPWFVEIPAFFFIGFWFISQLFNGLLSLAFTGPMATYGGVAWWAHVGGFIAGVLLAKPLRDRLAMRRWYADEYWPW